MKWILEGPSIPFYVFMDFVFFWRRRRRREQNGCHGRRNRSRLFYHVGHLWRQQFGYHCYVVHTEKCQDLWGTSKTNYLKVTWNRKKNHFPWKPRFSQVKKILFCENSIFTITLFPRNLYIFFWTILSFLEKWKSWYVLRQNVGRFDFLAVKAI